MEVPIFWLPLLGALFGVLLAIFYKQVAASSYELNKRFGFAGSLRLAEIMYLLGGILLTVVALAVLVTGTD